MFKCSPSVVSLSRCHPSVCPSVRLWPFRLSVCPSVCRPFIRPHRPPSTVVRPLSTVHRPTSNAFRPPSTVHHPPSTVQRPPSTVHRPPSILYRPTVHRPPSAELVTQTAGLRCVSANPPLPLSGARNAVWRQTQVDVVARNRSMPSGRVLLLGGETELQQNWGGDMGRLLKRLAYFLVGVSVTKLV